MTQCKYYDAGRCYAPEDIETNAVQGACIEPEYCGYTIQKETRQTGKTKFTTNKLLRLAMEKTQIPFNNEIEELKAQIKVLEKKLSFLEELEKTKSPVEEAYKDWWGEYPETGTWDGFDEKRWQGFQAGYNASQKDYKVGEFQEPEDNEWKNVALRFGEKLSVISPCGYYEFSAEEWFEWAVNTYDKNSDDYFKLLEKERQRVRKSKEFQPTPQTSEKVEEGLRKAFREAVKQGVVSKAQERGERVHKGMEELIEKMVENPPEFLKFELGQSLYDLIADWWDEIFTNGNPSGQNIESLIDHIEHWLPKKQSANSQNHYVECSVEGFNDCLKKIKSKLRNKQ